MVTRLLTVGFSRTRPPANAVSPTSPLIPPSSNLYIPYHVLLASATQAMGDEYRDVRRARRVISGIRSFRL
jgi:hypothetical protein